MSKEGLFVLLLVLTSTCSLLNFFLYFNFSFVPKLVVMDMNLLPYLMPSMMPQHLMLRVRTIKLNSSQELITCLLWVKSTTQMGEVGIRSESMTRLSPHAPLKLLSRKVRIPALFILLTSYNMAFSFVDLVVVDIKMHIIYAFFTDGHCLKNINWVRPTRVFHADHLCFNSQPTYFKCKILFPGGWCADHAKAVAKDTNQYLQLDLYSEKLIGMVETQGQYYCPNAVSKFTLSASNDGVNWVPYGKVLHIYLRLFTVETDYAWLECVTDYACLEGIDQW